MRQGADMAVCGALRLGLVGPLPPPLGGMANQTRQLARLLASDAIEVHLVRTNEPYRPAWVAHVRGVRAFARLLPYRRRLAAMSREVGVVHVMANSGWAWFLFAAPAIRAAVAQSVPVIVNYRGGLAREFLKRSAGRVLPMLRAASAVVVPSAYLRDIFTEYGVAVRIIPNIVDTTVFRSGVPARPVGHHVVVVRNLETIYGIDTAIRAVAILRPSFPELVVSIAGSGPERAALERLSAQLGVSRTIRFTGRLEVEQVAALYREADVALNPSRVDNAPNALLEAAASGVPIVSTDAGGVPHLVQHGRSAWLVPTDDPERMAQGVACVLRDAALRDTLRANAAALAAACSWPSVGRQWTDLYRSLALGNGDERVRAAAEG
ncbi:MAG: glycosyltransferase family 4 protein [Steroidobacteraceae bacterium]